MHSFSRCPKLAVPIDPTAQRRFAIEVVERLRAAGYVAYWAGGCVRDALLGLPAKDYDVATSARPDEIRTLFGKQRTLAIGAAFGVITVLGKKQAGTIEVATFRQDAAYSDGRHPDAVVFSTPEQDALRRDFTINGLFYDPLAEQVLDFVGGQDDLRQGLIRAIGQPRERFAEDKLRLLRAVRFAVRYGFQIEPATHRAIEEMADQIARREHRTDCDGIAARLDTSPPSPGSRIARRGRPARSHPAGRFRGARAAAESASGHDWAITLAVLDELDEPSFALALAALVHRLLSEERVAALGARLKLSTAETRRAAWLVAHYQSLLVAHTMPWPRLATVTRRRRKSGIARAGYGGGAGYRRRLKRHRTLPPPAQPASRGARSSATDYGRRPAAARRPPGPDYQRLLQRVRDAQLEKSIATQAEALALVDEAPRRRGSG